MTRKLIVGYDPAHGTDDVIGLTRVLAPVLDADPVIVTALPWPGYLATRSELERMADADMRDRFAELKSSLTPLRVETDAVPSTSPAEVLHAYAEQEEASLIVLGSSHRGVIGRTLIGSVGESLVQDAPCSIAVAPAGYGPVEDPPRLLRVGIGYDGSPEARIALRTAIAIAERCHADLLVITAADVAGAGFPGYWAAAADLGRLEREAREQTMAEALDSMPADLPAQGRVLTGNAGTVLRAASNELDLLLVGSRGYGSLRRTILGSTSRRLIRSSACPVLVTPRGVDPDPLGLVDAMAGTVEAPRERAASPRVQSSV